MPKTQVNCPNCHQPVIADIQQLYDLSVDPDAKQKLLAGAYNLIHCQNCGYQGNLSTFIVYHDPEKELLLTYVPTEIGLPRNDQERLIGSLINQVINHLPQEKRKGYLFNPQSFLTMQSLIERILEGDGITREMIQAQQQRINLLQRLASITDETARAELAKQEEQLIDAEFFALLSRLGEAALASGDRESARQLAELQRSLLNVTAYGQQIKAQSQEIEAALKDLQSLGQNLTREKMLDLVIHAPNETRLNALVSLARPVLDYQFFQLLSERIDKAHGDGRKRLAGLRTHLLELTQEIDRQIEEHRAQSHELVEAILQAENMNEAIEQSLPAMDEIFTQETQAMLKEAREKGDLNRSGKLQQILDAIAKTSEAPAELSLVEEYLDAPDDKARQAFLHEHGDQIAQGFMDLLANFALQVGSGADKNLADHVMAANRQALRFVMQRNLQQ